MTSASAWKKLERFWARLHGVERAGPKGTGHPDFVVEGPAKGVGLAVECKLQKRRTLNSRDIEQAQRNAASVGLPWVLILHEKGKEHLKHDLIVMSPETYIKLLTHGIWLTEAAHTALQEALTTCITYRKEVS